jgi:ubiquinone/menaquinone biosynthesis C-methylase UbiE
MKRIPQLELLDNDAGTPAEIAASLRDLQHINQWFGGVTSTEYLLRNAMNKASLSRSDVLEVAAGTGYSIRQAAERMRVDGLEIRVTALDRQASHMGEQDGVTKVVGDALNLPFSDNSFDFVFCNLFLHHLSPVDVIRFIDGTLRVCRHALLVNDLRRGATHLGLVYLGLPLFRSRITWNDAPASVRQAYTPAELTEMITKSRASKSEITNRFLYRMAATVWK